MVCYIQQQCNVDTTIPMFKPYKTSDVKDVGIGNIITYTVALVNTCVNTLTSLTFTDAIPDGLKFVPGSVTVNGKRWPEAKTQLELEDIPGGGTVVITFQALAEYVPEINPTLNQAQMSYMYSPLIGSKQEKFVVGSNRIAVKISPAHCQFASIALQREREISADGIVTFDIPLASKGDIHY